MAQQLDAKNGALESVILANNDAQTEINNLNDQLSALHASHKELKESFEPVREQNEAYQQRYEQNEKAVAAVKIDF